MAPSVWCMPSPKISLPSATAGLLTVGSLRYGADFFHAVRSPPGSTLKASIVETLKAPRLVKMMRLPSGSGEAMKCSWLLTAQSTLGAVGPGSPSVFAVRCGLPR